MTQDQDSPQPASWSHAFYRLRRAIIYLTISLIILAVVVALAAGEAITASHDVGVARAKAHDDTQQQIQQLACAAVAQIPSDHGGPADTIRGKYSCGPYTPPKALLQPKPGVVPSTP